MKNNKNISLDEIGNKIPFNVPENYFEQFATQFEEQITEKPVSVIRLLKPWMYMVAMFLGVFLMGRLSYTVYQNNNTKNAENYELYVMSQVNDVEVIDYYLTEQNNN